ncbi:heme ABC transporter ATP-binding protein [Kaustia mangrovi]|uniref:Heme ABC transporter ATP-binding protein n=1 Tax=Kaustia mangrovi TaxID=2593653 RepID=A0A7S8C1X9_9HYPH|nr:heme ABC transporter ATP-binding protein [Kaustia mangrovi]QPC41846.1 heme ABC transporter ATP-binding protein [Kaustia mangrovi]
MLDARDISVTLGGRQVLSPMTLSLGPGTFTVVVGPNGAGKSTLFKVLTGEIAPDCGTVQLDGTPLDEWPRDRLARRRAVLPQASHLAFPFTVYEVAALGLMAGGSSLPPALRDRLPMEALRRVGLDTHAGRFYQHLSGGEQQRVQIARVFCQLDAGRSDGTQQYLFLDEPISSLDLNHQMATLDLAREAARGGLGAVAILHDINLASLYADRLIVMADGRIVADGPPADVLTTEIVRSVFKVGLTLNHVPEGTRPFALPHSVGAAP